MQPEQRERVERELAILQEGGQETLIVEGSRSYVIYKAVPTSGKRFGLSEETDVIVPIPEGYAAAAIDLAGLPTGSHLLSRVAGGNNAQGTVETDGRSWQLASYHPHSNGGGPAWDQMQHGFHTYLDHLISWLAKLG